MSERIQGNLYIREATNADRDTVNIWISESSLWPDDPDIQKFLDEQIDNDVEKRQAYILERRSGRGGGTFTPIGYRQIIYLKELRQLYYQISLNSAGYSSDRKYFDWLINEYSNAKEIFCILPNAGLRALSKQRIPEITNDSENELLKYTIRD
jgi:hypothetical protein